MRGVNNIVDHYRQVRSIWLFGKYSQLLFKRNSKYRLGESSNCFNRPYSYSWYWTGSSMKWRLLRGNLFICKCIPPQEPPLYARFSSIPRIRIWPICLPYLVRHVSINQVNIWYLNQGSIWILDYLFHERIIEHTNGINFALMNSLVR